VVEEAQISIVIWVSGGLDMGFAKAQPYSTTSTKLESEAA